jgi:hypothetical protein
VESVNSVVHRLWLRQAALGISRFFAAHQLNFLSMNNLHTESAFFNRSNSCLIKPDQVIFSRHPAHNSTTPFAPFGESDRPGRSRRRPADGILRFLRPRPFSGNFCPSPMIGRKTRPFFLNFKRCLPLALAVLGVNYVAAAGGLPAPTPASVVRDEAAGQLLAKEIRSSMPAENMERSGVLVIKSGKNKTQIPVRCQVKLHDATWETDYQTADTPAAGAERLLIIHSTNGPSQYLYARAPKPGAALPEPAPLSPGQLDAPFAGSDFSLSDLGLEFLHWPGQCQLLPGEMRKGQPCYLLESANSRKEGIARVKSSIDKESLGPLYAEAYDTEGKKIKEFSLDSMKKDARGRYNVKEMEIDNIKLNSTTDLIFDIPKVQ